MRSRRCSGARRRGSRAGRRSRRRSTTSDAEDDEAVETGGQRGGRNRDAQRHSADSPRRSRSSTSCRRRSRAARRVQSRPWSPRPARAPRIGADRERPPDVLPVTVTATCPPECTTATQRSGSSRACGGCRHASSLSARVMAGNIGAGQRRSLRCGHPAVRMHWPAAGRAIHAARPAPKRSASWRQASAAAAAPSVVMLGAPVLLPVVLAPSARRP